jgi:hypothetical protein
MIDKVPVGAMTVPNHLQLRQGVDGNWSSVARFLAWHNRLRCRRADQTLGRFGWNS